MVIMSPTPDLCHLLMKKNMVTDHQLQPWGATDWWVSIPMRTTFTASSSSGPPCQDREWICSSEADAPPKGKGLLSASEAQQLKILRSIRDPGR